MKKNFLFLLFISLFFSTGYTLNGGISYTVNQAREVSFKNVPYSIDINKYQKYLIDKNYVKNKEALNKNKTQYKNRYLSLFSSGFYAVTYKNNTNVSYYYDSNSNLQLIDFIIGNDYPSKRVGYNSKGILNSVTLDVSANEQFVFNKNKKLIAHWIGKNCYNEQGELIMTRE